MKIPRTAAPLAIAAFASLLAFSEPARAERSPVPTTKEWDDAKEVTVTGSTALNCETKMVREWLRVSCRGKSSSGGKPTAVSLTRGGGKGDTFTFAQGDVASLVCPFVDGTFIEAEFKWTDKKKKLVVKWPHGAPKPSAMGVFQ